MAKAASLLMSIAVISVALAGFGQSAPNPNERDLPKGWAEAPSSKANANLWECAGYGGSEIVSLEDGSVHIGRPSDEEAQQVPLPQYLKLSQGNDRQGPPTYAKV